MCFWFRSQTLPYLVYLNLKKWYVRSKYPIFLWISGNTHILLEGIKMKTVVTQVHIMSKIEFGWRMKLVEKQLGIMLKQYFRFASYWEHSLINCDTCIIENGPVFYTHASFYEWMDVRNKRNRPFCHKCKCYMLKNANFTEYSSNLWLDFLL